MLKTKLKKKKKVIRILTPAQILEREKKRAREAACESHRTIGTTKAIREFCVICSGGSRQEVKHCPAIACPLWHFRTVQARRDNLAELEERK